MAKSHAAKRGGRQRGIGKAGRSGGWRTVQRPLWHDGYGMAKNGRKRAGRHPPL
ncbi:hypothetical protein V475_14285 [Sphingobium baderi LL03]|uniref:Uncharacterized protein n=1 Tax=Sphingobium baderi LL03 TaxID=1114964 RepID=T0G5V9_9SPHN|nr:hypothetical protein L485_16155 [Sphingobium baderi LL03]KMS61599.1 hypothetical protein V475_14285 [Sphingobium baderi LL03]